MIKREIGRSGLSVARAIFLEGKWRDTARF
jgi:hypothetical protein